MDKTVEIVILAMVAAFLGLRLYSVLGRRAEHEEEIIPGRSYHYASTCGACSAGCGLVVKNRDGAELKLTVTDNPLFVAIVPSTMADIKQGMFVGSAGMMQPDGVQKAIEVHIFPESMRGTGEGHRPMDTPGNTMTNATVSSVVATKAATQPGNTMTNATVSQIASGAPERRLTLTYAGGEKVVIVPANTPIVMVEPADRSLLVAGAHVIVNATRQADGVLTADRITIGKNGFVPPL